MFLFFVFFWFLANNAIKLIEESKFSQLFKNDNQSTINLLGNQLNCADVKPFIWLLKQKSDLESRVIYAECANGTDFWDLNPNFDSNDNSSAKFSLNIFLLLITSIVIYTNLI
jgi:hypothetical protein